VSLALAAGLALAPRAAAAGPDYAAETVARAAAEGPATELDVTLDSRARRISGHARLRIVNDGGDPMTVVNLWLYPNVLAKRWAALNDVKFHWLYPGGFSPAGIEISNARADGVPAPMQIMDYQLVGERAMAQVTLAAPLPQGHAVTIDVDFDTRIPERYGAFGCVGARCRLMGGFYPMPSSSRGPNMAFNAEAPAVPRAGRARITLRLPPGLALVLDGQPIVNDAGGPVTVAGDDVRYPTIVTDEVLRPATATMGAHAITYLHRRPRPPPSEDQPMPYVREDVAGLVLATARQALALADAAGLPPDVPLTLVEAPLRHELVQQHGDVILVSDQIFRIFPIDRLRKYHRMEIARAVFATVADAAVRAHELPVDRERAAGVIAAYLTDVYARAEFQYIEYFRELLSPFDFVPVIDQLLYAPLLASPSSYFGDVDDRDLIRDGVGRFAWFGPGPRLLYSKLVDLVGPARFPALARKLYAEHTPLRRAAAEMFGADLQWFWNQWLVVVWPVNYRLESVKVTPGAAGSHVAIVVRSEHAVPIRELVEVRVLDRGGGDRTLTWDGEGDTHQFDVDLPAGLSSVEIDPRHRLVESTLSSPSLRSDDDPRVDNRNPRRWRLLYEGAGALLNLSQSTLNFAVSMLAKPQYDLRRQIEATVFHDESSRLGVDLDAGRSFGRQADRNRLTTLVFAGLSGARLDPSFGTNLGQQPHEGWRLSGLLGLEHDTRDFFYDPWRAVGLAVDLRYTLTALDDGDRLSQVTAGVELLRLFELAPGHVLAVDGASAATFGDIRTFAQLPSAGGPAALRGYATDELLSRAFVLGRLELRDDYVSGLDWNLLHFTTVRGFAGTLFADATAIATCESYGLSRERVYFDAGYSFRVLHDAFGIQQQLLSINVAVPLNRHDPYASCLNIPRAPVSRPLVVVLLSFFPSF
jgi:hypothetical protein